MFRRFFLNHRIRILQNVSSEKGEFLHLDHLPVQIKVILVNVCIVVVIAYIVALSYGRLLPLIFVIVLLLGCWISLEYRISLLIWVWHRTDNNCCYSFSLFDLLFCCCCCCYFLIFFFFTLVWNKIVFLNTRTLDQAFVCPSVCLSIHPLDFA